MSSICNTLVNKFISNQVTDLQSVKKFWQKFIKFEGEYGAKFVNP